MYAGGWLHLSDLHGFCISVGSCEESYLFVVLALQYKGGDGIRLLTGWGWLAAVLGFWGLKPGCYKREGHWEESRGVWL